MVSHPSPNPNAWLRLAFFSSARRVLIDCYFFVYSPSPLILFFSSPMIIVLLSLIYHTYVAAPLHILVGVITMFSADLSWTDPNVEKVGERKERIAKERSTSSTSPSIKSCSKSSRDSISSAQEERELWWTSSLRKAKSLKPLRKTSTFRPGSSRSFATEASRKSSGTHSRHAEVESTRDVHNPVLQPAWAYSHSLPPRHHPRKPLDPSVHEVPELEGDGSSHGTTSSGSRSSRKSERSKQKTRNIHADSFPRQMSGRGASEAWGESDPSPKRTILNS